MIKFNFDTGLSQTAHVRVKTPTLLQMDPMECGAVCLGIILAYFNLYVSSEDLRENCGVTRDGSKAINIIKAARALGMDAEGQHIYDLDKLRYVPTPFIIYWKFNHFIVIEGIIKNKVYINDPATGPRIISLEELDKDFTGVVLRMTPSEEFRPNWQKEKSIYSLLYDYFKTDVYELGYLLCSSILLAFPQASLALFIEFFIDNILVKDQKQWMPGYIFIMSVILISVISLLWIQQYFLVRYKLLFSIKKIPEFFNKLLHLPMSFYAQRSTGDMTNRMHIFDEISEKITRAFSDSVINFLSIIIFSLIITLINIPLGCITILITALNFGVIMITRRKIVDLGRRYSQDQAKMHSIEYSGVQMIESLKFMGGENRFFTRWLSFKSKLIDSQQRIDFYTAFISLLPQTLYFFNLVLVVILGIHFVMIGTMTLGGVIAIYTLLLLFSSPVIDVVNNVLKINEMKANLLRVNDVEASYKKHKKSSDVDQINTENFIEVKEINFGYSKLEAPILMDINFNIKQGKMTAITGVSGGGKSSLLNLICGLFDPWYGGIYLAGKNVKNYPPAELYKLISYVDQNIYLFEGSIRDNLTMWDNSIDEERIIRALKMACIYDIVISKGGLDFHIQEGGNNLSLGEAQRIELARAFIKQPKVLLIDEATSSIDSVTEAKIYENLRLMECTILLVAHRLSAIRHCDEIIVIEDGAIIERGSHEELLNLKGRYKEFLTRDYLS